jgi:YesN/AraC family two-component response regulator
MYIDRVSSDFARRIEEMTRTDDSMGLMYEMFRTYCRLVRKHSLKGYSATVRRAVLIIDSDLSGELSLKPLAEALKVSPGYLSGIFKRDTGKTLTEYVRERRMEEAMHLLTTTSLEIQTVALHTGIVDVQYFSKQFKAYTGLSPREYREREKG